MSKADKIKTIVKGPAPKETFGTNPSDPWSTKANIAEWAGNPTGLLGKYLKSRGINPKFATKDQKIAHSKTGQFAKWQKDHEERSSPTGTTIRGESTDMCNVCGQTPCNCTSIEEAVDKKDTITFDIPLLIRVLELAREDIKSDMDLHRVVERLIDMRSKGMLTMDDYDAIAAIKEEVYSSVKLEYIKQALSEAKEANYGGDYQNSVLALKKKAEQKKVDMKSLADRMQAAYRRENQKNANSVKEDISRRGILKGILGGAAAGAAGKASAIAGAFPSPSTRAKWAKDAEESNRNEAKRQAEKKKKELEDNTKEVERQQKINHHSLANEEIVNEMDGDGAGRDGSNRKSHSTYGSRDKHTVSNGPDVHLGPKSIMKKSDVVKGALSSLKKAFVGDPADGPRKTMGLHASLEKHQDDMMKKIGHKFQPSVKKEETLGEGNGYDDNRTGFAKKPREDDEGHAPTKFKAKSTMDRPHTVHIDGKPWKKFSNGHQAHAAVNTLTAKGKKAVAIAHFKEDTYQDPQAATQTVFDGGNNPNDITPPEYKGKRLIQMSKSARIIKNLYRVKGMKEETYDFEKADKSVDSYGKPPKVTNLTKKSTDGDKEKAAIVLSGGTTLTGDERDTIEIDPKMKMRPNQPEPTKSGKPQVK